jgi:hypothetical protein
VICSPYGESLRRQFATEAEAQRFAAEIAGMTGTYNTSWGEQAVNTEVTILHYASAAPTPIERAVERADAILAQDGVSIRGLGYTLTDEDGHVIASDVPYSMALNLVWERKSGTYHISRNGKILEEFICN